MLPNNENYDDELEEDDDNEFEIIDEPSLTYAMQVADKIDEDSIFCGRVDDIDAIKQAVLKILSTERYEYEIYSWDYGFEIQDLIGESIPYVMSELKVRITDALTADDRIESVEDFTVEKVGKRTLHCTFTVVPEQGEEFQEETEVEV